MSARNSGFWVLPVFRTFLDDLCNEGSILAQAKLETTRMDEAGIDRETMARLARALGFIKSPEDPVVAALRKAAESGAERDIKRARSLFLKLKPADRRAALAAIADTE